MARNGNLEPVIEVMNGVEKKQSSNDPHPGSLEEFNGRCVAPQT